MKNKYIVCLFAALFLILSCVPIVDAEVNAENDGRNIYAGDLITLEISAEDLSAGAIREAFRDFEILELKEESERYLLTIRTFEPGEYSVLLRNKEIVIEVASALDDFEREDVFEGGTDIIESGTAFPWRMLFYLSAGMFVLSGGMMLVKMLLRRKRTKKLTPYEIFLRSAGTLTPESDRFFVDLTLLFKTYIESLYSCRIIGKTSSEIVNELKELQAIGPVLPALEAWLMECDKIKFTGVKVSSEKKQAHYETLLDLVKKIHLLSTDAQKEGAA